MDLTRYGYDRLSGVYVGPVEASVNPERPANPLEPAFSTPIRPPTLGAGEAAVWSGAAWGTAPDHRGETWYRDRAPVAIADVGDPAALGLSREPAPFPVSPIPDGPTLSDWRVGLTLWGRIDDVSARVGLLIASSDPRQAVLGRIAKERLEYANNVLRAQLLALKDALGFSEADVDESLWRAAQVTKGDLSGVWPLP